MVYCEMVYEFDAKRFLDEKETAQLAEEINAMQGQLILTHGYRMENYRRGCYSASADFYHKVKSGVIAGKPRILERQNESEQFLRMFGAGIVVPVRNKVFLYSDRWPHDEVYRPLSFMHLNEGDLRSEERGELLLQRCTLIRSNGANLRIYLGGEDIVSNSRLIGNFFNTREELIEILKNPERFCEAPK